MGMLRCYNVTSPSHLLKKSILYQTCCLQHFQIAGNDVQTIRIRELGIEHLLDVKNAVLATYRQLGDFGTMIHGAAWIETILGLVSPLYSFVEFTWKWPHRMYCTLYFLRMFVTS